MNTSSASLPPQKVAARSGTISRFWIGFLVFANLLAFNWIASLFSVRVDLTQGRDFALSPESERYLKRFQAPVKIYFFPTALLVPGPETNRTYRYALREIVRETVRRMQALCPSLDFEEVDALREPARFQDLKSTFQFSDDVLSPTGLLLTSEDRRQRLSREDLVAFDGDRFDERGQRVEPERPARLQAITGIRELRVESAILQAMGRLASQETVPIHFLAGHGEAGFSDYRAEGLLPLRQDLEAQGFSPRELLLIGRKEIPEEVRTLFIINPTRLFSDVEAEMISRWLDRGGKLCLACSARHDEALPGLQKILTPLGRSFNRDLVLQTRGIQPNGTADVLPTAPRCQLPARGGAPLLRGLSDQLFVVFDAARSIERLSGKTGAPGVVLYQAGSLDYGETSPGEFFEKRVATFRSNEDLSPPRTVAEMLVRPAPNNPKEIETFCVILGDGGFLTNQYLEQGANRDLARLLMTQLAGRELRLNIQPKTIRTFKIQLSEDQMRFLFWGLGVGLPALAVGLGLFILWRRRR